MNQVELKHPIEIDGQDPIKVINFKRLKLGTLRNLSPYFDKLQDESTPFLERLNTTAALLADMTDLNEEQAFELDAEDVVIVGERMQHFFTGGAPTVSASASSDTAGPT